MGPNRIVAKVSPNMRLNMKQTPCNCRAGDSLESERRNAQFNDRKVPGFGRLGPSGADSSNVRQRRGAANIVDSGAFDSSRCAIQTSQQSRSPRNRSPRQETANGRSSRATPGERSSLRHCPNLMGLMARSFHQPPLLNGTQNVKRTKHALDLRFGHDDHMVHGPIGH